MDQELKVDHEPPPTDPSLSEDPKVFEGRKLDHLRLSLSPHNQALSLRDLDQVELLHEALPEFNFADVDTTTTFAEHKVSVPYFISSMTAGHHLGREINQLFLEFSEEQQVLFAVGSQRRDLESEMRQEWSFRSDFPRALVCANIGVAQLISHGVGRVLQLVQRVGAIGLFIHLNPLQECLQPEGTPNFAGASEKLRQLVRECPVPVIIKEVGCGLNVSTLKRLSDLGLKYFDVSGGGGTHWGRIEADRVGSDPVAAGAAAAFRNWGQGTAFCLAVAQRAELPAHLWASGGVRSGVDVAKLLAMGAEMVGLAKPWIEVLLESESPGQLKIREAAARGLRDLHRQLRLELATAMFCTGAETVAKLRASHPWQRRG